MKTESCAATNSLIYVSMKGYVVPKYSTFKNSSEKDLLISSLTKFAC